MVENASPRVSNTRSRGIPSGSHVFSGSFEFAVPYCLSGLLRLKSFSPSGVIGGNSSDVVAFSGPAQAPLRSRLGAGPPLLGSLASNWLYKVLPNALPAWAMAAGEKLRAASRETIAAVNLRIEDFPSRLSGVSCGL